MGEKAKKVKQKLLEEMLRQKHELERKQAERQKVSLAIMVNTGLAMFSIPFRLLRKRPWTPGMLSSCCHGP